MPASALKSGDLSRHEVVDFLARINTTEPWHNPRYLITFERIQSLLIPGASVLDLGGRSPFTELLERHGKATITCEPFDLRHPFPLADRSFDMVLCLEVIEHVKDRETARIDELSEFTFSGVRNCLGEAWRVLKPGGLLVLTTPNACSYRSLWNVLEHRHPYQYPPHNRELSLPDVNQLLTESGFLVETLGVIDAWSNGCDAPSRIERMGRRARILSLALATRLLGFSTRDRDDDILAMARRPAGMP